MNWESEPWVKLYTRDTVTWSMLCWQARFVLMSLLRKVDRAGIVDVNSHGDEGVAELIRAPVEVVSVGLAQLLEAYEGADPIIVRTRSQIVLVSFVAAQAALTSPKERVRRSRDLHRDLAKREAESIEAYNPVTQAIAANGSDAHISVTRLPPPPSYMKNGGGNEDAREDATANGEGPNKRVTNRKRVPSAEAEPRYTSVVDTTKAKVDATLVHFADRFAAAYGNKPSRPSNRLLSRFAALVKHHGDELVRANITRAFESPPSWPPPPYDLGSIVNHFDRFTATAITGTNGATRDARFGRLEPTRVRDGKLPDWEIVRRAKEGPMPWDD